MIQPSPLWFLPLLDRALIVIGALVALVVFVAISRARQRAYDAFVARRRFHLSLSAPVACHCPPGRPCPCPCHEVPDGS